VVGDATIKGSETGTSFRQALYFKECGFNLHDTMIYQKSGTGACGSNYTYWQSFEYMFVLSKGRPKTINRLRQINTSCGTKQTRGRIAADGSVKDTKVRITQETGFRPNIWRYSMNPRYIFSSDKAVKHPARFPEQLAEDHILSWSNEEDLVFDPFLGSGTTAKMALKNNRNFIGCDISNEYCALAKQRIKDIIV
jgi:site-specific DNA-methyltransferase (adenine-specific)